MPSSFEMIVYGIIRFLVAMLPWAVIALFAILAYIRTRSLPTLIQALGALFLFLGWILILLLPYLLAEMKLPMSSYFRIQQIFAIFVLGLGTLTFAAGYIIERIPQVRRPARLSAFPVDPAGQPPRP